MPEPDGAPSLIMQRIALERERAFGAVRLVRSRRRIRDSEAEHGADAGRQ